MNLSEAWTWWPSKLSTNIEFRWSWIWPWWLYWFESCRKQIVSLVNAPSRLNWTGPLGRLSHMMAYTLQVITIGYECHITKLLVYVFAVGACVYIALWDFAQTVWCSGTKWFQPTTRNLAVIGVLKQCRYSF